MWLLERCARLGIKLFNRFQFAIWPLQISAHFIWSQDVAGRIPSKDRPDL